MSRAKQVQEFEIEIAGEPYVWWLQRHPKWSSHPDDCHGMALGVHHKEGQRELILEFPVGPRPRFGAPQLKPQSIKATLVERAISSAIAAGWEPLSRGKTVTIVVDESGA